MNRRTATLFTIILTAGLMLSGCATTAGPSPAQTEDAPIFNDADVTFVTTMIPHHEQAIEMSEIVLAKDDLDPDVAELAEAIQAAQGPEIEQLQTWLDAWGVDEHAGHGSSHDEHEMDGMMTSEDLAALEAASGPEASRLFLEQMIEHHEGAVDMARTQLEDGSNPEALALAQEIIDAQTSEIEQMREILSRL